MPGTIEAEQSTLDGLHRQERQAAEGLRKAAEVDARRPELMAERSGIRRELDEDARARTEHLGGEGLPPRWLERLGPKPASPAGAELWLDAAGRVDQHHAAFDLPEESLLGRRPDLIGDDVYASSHRAASQAVGRLDRGLRRQPEIELPHQGIELSL